MSCISKDIWTGGVHLLGPWPIGSHIPRLSTWQYRGSNGPAVLWQSVQMFCLGREVRYALRDLRSICGDRMREWMACRMFCRRIGRVVLPVP